VEDAVDHADQEAKLLKVFLCLGLLRDLIDLRKLVNSRHQVLQQIRRQVLNHVVHLHVQIVRSEHEAILLADLFDRFKAQLDASQFTSLLQVLSQLGHERRPLFVYEALAHKCDNLEEDLHDPIALAAHDEADEVLLEHLDSFSIDEGVWVFVLITSDLLTFTSLGIFGVVGEIVCLEKICRSQF
jgi:hypothetical protein